MVYALLGNPHSGKTALFEALCEKGIWHKGTAIAYQEGKISATPHSVLDLPGICSLKALNEKEGALIEYLGSSPPDAILNVVDLTSLTKDLYLTVSLLSLRLPTVLVLTKKDQIDTKSIRPDVLAESLGVPVIAVCAPRKEGLNKLKGQLSEPKRPHPFPRSMPPPPTFYQQLLSSVSEVPNAPISLLLEDFLLSDTPSLYTVSKLKKSLPVPLIFPSCERAESLILFRRKGCKLLSEKVLSSSTVKNTDSFSDRVLLSSPLSPFLSFLSVSLFCFLSVGPIANTLTRFLGSTFELLLAQVLSFLKNGHTAPFLAHFMTDGLLRGIFGVMSLLPIVWSFSFFISAFRESGYLKRVTIFLGDPFEKESDRECFRSSLLLISLLFSKKDAPFAFILFLFLGICKGLSSVFIRRFKKSHAPPIESIDILVPIHFPFLRKCQKEATKDCISLIKHCFSTIFLCAAGVWILSSLTPTLSYAADKNSSLLAYLFSSVAPLFAPMGMADWRILFGLFIALFSKKGAIAALTILAYDSGGEIASLFFAPNALSFSLFILLFPKHSLDFNRKKAKSNSQFLSILMLLLQITLDFLFSSLIFSLASHL